MVMMRRSERLIDTDSTGSRWNATALQGLPEVIPKTGVADDEDSSIEIQRPHGSQREEMLKKEEKTTSSSKAIRVAFCLASGSSI